MKRALLDVNVLIALLDAAHVHHARAHAWLATNARAGWASCPLTENGCIRVMSNAAYPGPLAASSVAARLAEATKTPHHEFWPDDLSLLTPGALRWERLLGSRQLTDAYLLALATRRNGRFATFDTGAPVAAVSGAGPEHLAVL